MFNIINLTPHTITILNEDGTVLKQFPSEGVARATQSQVYAGHLDGIELVRTSFGAPIGLPEPQMDTYYIVSLATANAAKYAGRRVDDLLLTSDPVRDSEGRIIGCRRLALL